jgi:hypothetical protein
MNITPKQFLTAIKDGKTERELNLKESSYVNPVELKRLTSERYGHTIESATKYLLTDYSNGFTICRECGSFYPTGKGFTKHLSNGCLHCEGEEKHPIYFVNASKPSEGGFPARWISQMFDDGMSYCKDKLEIGMFAEEIEQLTTKTA